MSTAAAKCVKCTKTAYPLESIRAGDDTWHKGCFKCAECGIQLNQKTFKKRESEVYCATCVPKDKPNFLGTTGIVVDK